MIRAFVYSARQFSLQAMQIIGDYDTSDARSAELAAILIHARGPRARLPQSEQTDLEQVKQLPNAIATR